MERHVYASEHDFLHKLEDLLKSGVKPENIETRTPHPVLHAEELLRMKPSNVRLFDIDVPGLRRYYLVYPARLAGTPKLAQFRGWLHDEIRAQAIDV